MANEETNLNRAELEYTARVNRGSFAQAREEVRRETQQAASEARQAVPATGGGEVEALRRERAERDRLRQERNAARTQDLGAVRAVSDEEFRIMERLNRARNRADRQEIEDKKRVRDQVVAMAREKALAEEKALRSGAPNNLLYPGTGPANFNLQGGYRSSLLARAGGDELDAFRMMRGGGGGRGPGGPGGFGGGSFGGRSIDPFLLSLGFGLFSAVPGGQQIGGLAVGAGFGGAGGIAGAGVALGGAALIESIRLYKEQQDALHSLTIVLHNTDQSFVQTSASAEIFASSLGLSRSEATKLAGSLAELNLKSGLNLGPQQAQQLSTLFGAHGLSPDEQAKTIKQLSTNAAEAFEQLTGLRADVTIDDYARSVGKTSDQLTRMEKQQVIVNELLKRSGEYASEAALRQQSLTGQWDRFTSQLKDVGGAVGQQAIFTLRTLILLQPANKITQNVVDYAQGRPTQSAGGYFSDIFGGYAYRTSAAEADLPSIIHNRQIAERQKSQNAELERERQQRIADEQERRAIEQRRYFESRDRSDIEAKRFSESSRLKEALEQRDRFDQSRGGFSTDDAQKFANQFEDIINSAMSNARDKIISFSKTFRDEFANLAQLQLPGERDNPYVKLFSDGATAAARAREQFGLAGDDVVESILKAQRAAQEAAVYELRIKDNLSAIKLEFEAANLSKPFVELTREMKNTISVFQLEVQSALKGPELLFKARQIETGGYAQEPYLPGGPLQGFRGLQFENLRRLRGRYAGEEGLGGDEIKHLIDEQLIKLYDQLSPGERSQVFQFGEARFDFANAFRGEEAYGRKQIELQIQRNLANLSNVRLAEQQLKELARLSQGQDRDITRRAFLDVTGSLSREELTPDIIKGRTVALQEEARFVREREERARKAVEATEKFQNLVQERLQQLLNAVESRNEKVIIEVLDRTDNAKISTLGQSF